ncbi:MAG: hypothetical protein Q8M01_05525 [Rubrivivax sp.]|nr:hypothetical protein [Rubrivivax sp.]
MATRRSAPARTHPARSPRPAFVRSLLLPRAFAAAFGLREAALPRLLAESDPGRDAAGLSGCARALGALVASSVAPETLRRWDLAIAAHESAVGAARAAHALAAGQAPQVFRLTHFQWLACAVVEWHLEALAADAAAHVARLEALRERELPHLPTYSTQDARKLACFMATGAGKTLVLHLNLRQFLAHRLFEPQSMLLLTPNEALSAQHRAELQASGLGALGVRVAEITKFYVDAPGSRRPKKGVSEATSRYEGPNLLLVDEGHKGGTSGGEKDWRAIREALAGGSTEAQTGFTFEYSATFAQIADKDAELYDEYARCVALDFGYARFWREGYGKQPRQINARQEAGADFALAAGLLAFYQQRRAYRDHPALAHDYLVAAPLLACVGKDVTAGDAEADVARLVAFLARACGDPAWLAQQIEAVLAGAEPAQAGIGLPALDLRWLRQTMAERAFAAPDIAADLARAVFGGTGSLTLHLVGANEIGLKCLGAADDAYFGVVRVGEARKLAETLHRVGIAARGEPDRLAGSLFARLDTDDRLSVLIGAKMFVEGWSSWRVSSLALMNVGRSPGAEIVQLFGRGVRLRGRGFSLKRDEDAPLPVQALQSLQVFGVRADYLQQFLDMLAREGVQPQVLHLPVTQQPPIAALGLHTLALDEGRFAECVGFDPATVLPQRLAVDPDVRVSAGLGPAQALGGASVLRPSLAGWLDTEPAYQHALRVKRQQGLSGLVFGPKALQDYLAGCSVSAPPGWFEHPALGTARRVPVALAALEKGLVLAWRQAGRRWRMQRLAVAPLTEANAGLPRQWVNGLPQLAWRLEVDVARGAADAVMDAARAIVEQGLRPPAFLDALNAFLADQPGGLLDVAAQVQALLDDPAAIAQETLKLPLPRLHAAPHLYAPVLMERALRPAAAAALPAAAEQMPLFGGDAWIDNAAVTVRPPALNEGESKFLWDLRAWWATHHACTGWRDVHLYVLRNPAAGGLRLYRDSGFAPDFMLWIKRGEAQALGLVDPKGLARGWPQDKLDMISDLEVASLSLPVRAALVTATLPEHMALPPGMQATAASLWTARILRQSDAEHIDQLMNHLRAALGAPAAP